MPPQSTITVPLSELSQGEPLVVPLEALMPHGAANAVEQPSSGALRMAAAAKVVPAATRVVEELATNPAVPRVAAKVGKVVGAVAPAVVGGAEGGPIGALAGVAAASKGAWAGGKTGWFTGKLAQEVAGPVASILGKVAPYVQTLSTVSGIQGGLDLAQMAEPKRQDLGFLGVGKSINVIGAHPALVNLLVSKVTDAVNALMSHGLSKDDAIAAVKSTARTGAVR